jgi:hypothetical protein
MTKETETEQKGTSHQLTLCKHVRVELPNQVWQRNSASSQPAVPSYQPHRAVCQPEAATEEAEAP